MHVGKGLEPQELLMHIRRWRKNTLAMSAESNFFCRRFLKPINAYIPVKGHIHVTIVTGSLFLQEFLSNIKDGILQKDIPCDSC